MSVTVARVWPRERGDRRRCHQKQVVIRQGNRLGAGCAVTASNDNDPVIVNSERSCHFEKDGIEVEARICKLEDSDEWALQVIEENGVFRCTT